jgi:hypothetical protein
MLILPMKNGYLDKFLAVQILFWILCDGGAADICTLSILRESMKQRRWPRHGFFNS